MKVKSKPEINNNYRFGLVTDFFVCDKYCPLNEGFIVRSRILNAHNVYFEYFIVKKKKIGRALNMFILTFIRLFFLMKFEKNSN